MPDGLYERDILAWSQQQAELIRRPGPGLRANDLDWENIAQQIESAGRTELASLRRYLTLSILHVLKLHVWPNADSVRHWRGDIVGFQNEAEERFTPSMRQRVDVAKLCKNAVKQIHAADPAACVPPDNPFTLDDPMHEDWSVLLGMLPFAP